MQTINVGTKVYYTGDRANQGGKGVITAASVNYYTIKMDDGRIKKGIFVGEVAQEKTRNKNYYILN